MATRFSAVAVTTLLALMLAPAGAPAAEEPPAATTKPAAPAAPVKPPLNRSERLDLLFKALKVAPDAESARFVEQRIWAVWLESGSDTCDLLMTRVKQAMDAKNTEVAIKLLDAVIAIRPDYVEAYNQRATVYFAQKDFGRSVADIRQVLAREPRHFGAWMGLGLVLQEIGDEKRALAAFRKALALDPHLERIPDMVKSLTDKVEGRDI